MSAKFSGGCLCGAVRYKCQTDPVVTGFCQCTDCRKSSGSGHSAHLAVPLDAVKISGEVAKYDRPADSGNMVTRAFCPKCGSPVYSTNSAIPQMIVFRASSLDDPEIFPPEMVVYTSRAPSWDRIDPDLPAFATNPPGGPADIIRRKTQTAHR
ncbi:MAG: GFA family protein [Alphaproteobacteria bacterium]